MKKVVKFSESVSYIQKTHLPIATSVLHKHLDITVINHEEALSISIFGNMKYLYTFLTMKYLYTFLTSSAGKVSSISSDSLFEVEANVAVS